MVMVRVKYTLTFKTVSELHVGSGETKPREANGNAEPQGECALFVKDASGNPWIPGSTLKGAFVANSGDRFKQLFGQPHAEGVKFAQGELTFFGLKSKQRGLLTEKVRTAVDAGTGASAARKLFAQNYVFRGAEFKGDIVLQCGADRLASAKAEVLACLNRFARAEGIPIASGKADGLGRLCLTGVEATEQQLGKEGWSAPTAVSVALEPEADEDWHVFELLCTGPYMVSGPVKQEVEGQTEYHVTHAERIEGGAPRLFPTGVAGALRARALWLAELDALRTEATLEDTVTPVKTSAGERPLNVVQRLFGDEGYRASVAMKLDLDPAKPSVQTNHPAGPLDPVLQLPKTVPVDGKAPKGALHKRNADTGVRLRLSLRLWRTTPQQDELDLFEKLKKDIKDNGLTIGLGTAKGFGWFGIEPTSVAPPLSKRALNTKLNPEREKKLPAPEISLPYRQVEVDPDKIGFPEETVVDAHSASSLWSKPLPDGLSGWVDVSWCFETPMLVGDTAKADRTLRFRDGTAVPPGLVIRTPQYLGDDPVLPGTTLRGAMRSLIETVTAARIGDHRMNPYRLDDGDERDYPFKSVAAAWRKLPSHSPVYDAEFVPDFTDALFGFISPEGGNLSPKLHARLHLKSRVSFGWARMISDHDAEAGNIVHRAVLLSPRVGSVFMDHVSRRVYPATVATSAEVLKALAESLPKPNAEGKAKKEDTLSYLRFLHPLDDQPLVFRGRIRFHNVTKVELGALLWAITLGMGSGMRHMIGTARPFGAGRCYATDLTMEVRRNDGKDATERSESPATAQFGPDGDLAKTYVDAFNKWLTAEGLRTPGFQERLAAADPAYAAELARRAGGFAYQTNEGLKRSLKDPDGKKRKDIARANGGGNSNKGRLAAMMRRS